MSEYTIENGDVFEVLNDKGGRANMTFPLMRQIEGFFRLAGREVNIIIKENSQSETPEKWAETTFVCGNCNVKLVRNDEKIQCPFCKFVFPEDNPNDKDCGTGQNCEHIWHTIRTRILWEPSILLQECSLCPQTRIVEGENK